MLPTSPNQNKVEGRLNNNNNNNNHNNDDTRESDLPLIQPQCNTLELLEQIHKNINMTPLDVTEKLVSSVKLFFIGTPSRVHLFGHLLWSIFQSSLHITLYNFFKFLHVSYKALQPDPIKGSCTLLCSGSIFL